MVNKSLQNWEKNIFLIKMTTAFEFKRFNCKNQQDMLVEKIPTSQKVQFL